MLAATVYGSRLSICGGGVDRAGNANVLLEVVVHLFAYRGSMPLLQSLVWSLLGSISINMPPRWG